MKQAAEQLQPKPIKVAGVLFDLDGTMVDSVPDIHPAINRMLADLGLPAVDITAVRTWIGNGAARLVQRALTAADDGGDDPKRQQQALALYMEYYRRDVCHFSKPYPGVIETLDNLSQRGFRLACVTNKPASHTLPLLDQLGMRDYFKTVVSGDTLSVRKPDPEPLHYGCRQLSLETNACLMVGDSASDIKAAHAAAMPVFCVAEGYNQGVDLAALKPDALISDFRTIAAVVMHNPKPIGVSRRSGGSGKTFSHKL